MSALARIFAGVGVLLALGPVVVSGHPHVFVDYSIVFAVGARGPESLRVEWAFDAPYSSMLLQRYDADRNGVLSPQELRTIEEKHFVPLREEHYFLELKAGGRAVPVTGVLDVQAKVEKGRVTYGFTVPLPPLDPDQGEVEVLLEDAEFYVAFAIATRPARAEAPAAYQVDCSVVTGDAESIRCRYRRQR